MKAIKKISALALVLIMAMAVLAGCGGNQDNPKVNSDEQGIIDITAKLQKCMNDLDILGIYDCVEPEASAQVIDELESNLQLLGISLEDFKNSEYYSTFVEQFKAEMPFDIQTAKFEVTNIQIDGETATADLIASAEGIEDVTNKFSYVKVDGTWYIDPSVFGM